MAIAWTLAALAAAHGALPGAARASTAPPLPAPASEIAPDLRPVGSGELSWFGLSVYRAHFWSRAGEWRTDVPFALDIEYLRGFTGAQLARRSVEEMTRLGYGTAAQLAAWGDAMRRVFPDVERDDRITGLHVPGRGARFFHNGRLSGEITDPAFSEAFFAIWLHPKASRPELRRDLLGLRD